VSVGQGGYNFDLSGLTDIGFARGKTGVSVLIGCPATSGQIFFRREEMTDGLTLSDWSGFAPGLPVPSLKAGIGFRKEGCGAWVLTASCSGEKTHPVKLIKHSCKTISCPIDFADYLIDKSRDIEDRCSKLYGDAKLAENAKLIPGETRRQIKPRHFPFTMSPLKIEELYHKVVRSNGGWWDESQFLDLARAELKDCLHGSGLVGGCIIYHPDRVRHPGTGAIGSNAKMLIIREAKEAGFLKDEDPSWKMYAYINSRKNWEDYYYFSPHFHVVAYGKILDVFAFEEMYPGWKYQNKGVVNNVGGLAHYLLSHMAVIPGRREIVQWGHCVPAIPERKGLTWFGRLSSACLGKDETGITYHPVLCGLCGCELVITQTDDPNLLGQVLTKKVVHYTGFFRRDRRRTGPGDPGGGVDDDDSAEEMAARIRVSIARFKK
jgi:hypothetical protein